MNIHILDIQSDDIDNKFTITIYGKNEEYKNIVCHVTDFKPKFYLKIPLTWSKNKFECNIINKLSVHKNPYYKCESTILKKFYNDFYVFNPNDERQFKFAQLEFENYRSFYTYRKSIKEFYNKNKDNKELRDWIDLCINECESNIYEANIHPLLRFIHKININPSGWITISGKTVKEIKDEQKDFKCFEELTCICKNIKQFNNNNISHLIIASFDIECDSETGEFPQAKKDCKKLAETIISILLKYDDFTLELVKDIIKHSFNIIESDGYLFDTINKIKTTNGLPTEISINNLSFLNDNFIEDFKKIKEDKSIKNKLLKKVIKILNKELRIKIKGDPIIQIGTVFYNIGNKTYERVIQVIKPDGIDEEICDDIDNIIVDKCKDESELLEQWQKTINKYNPDMITGYNIFGFDFNYINDRCEELNVELDNLGRLNGNKDNIKKKHYNKQCKIKSMLFNKKEDEDNDGWNNPKYINMDGRIIFDVQKEITKSHSLSSYKLDNVASHFIRGNVLDNEIELYNYSAKRYKTYRLNDERMWIFKTNNIGHLKINDYITINLHSNIGESLLINGHKFKIFNISLNNHISIFIDNLKINKEISKFNPHKIEWCMNKDDVPPQEIFNLHKTGGPTGRAKVAKYCIQDCELCIHLVNLLDFIPNNIGMSNVCLVPLSYIFLRGQGIKVTSLVSKYCSNNYTKMPTLKDAIEYDDGTGYEGAIVLDPTTGIYLDDPIVVLDYASLYPSSIIEKNLSPDTCITDKKYIEENKDYINLIKYDDYELDTSKKTVKKVKVDTETECYFKPNKKDKNGKIIPSSMGIIPTVLQTLLNARKSTKKKIKTEPVEQKKKILDGLQLAYKLTANSVYGQLGARTSSIYKKNIAACTTSIGRERITIDAQLGVKEWAKNEGYDEPDIIYGDTDSVFIKFSRKDKKGNILNGSTLLKHVINCGIKSGKYVDNKLDAPQNLEYEKTFMPFILMSKKRYVGDKYESIEDVDKKKFKRTSMGIVLKRRDNAPIVKYVYGNIIEKIMVGQDYKLALEWLKKTLIDICQKKFHINYFIISKSLAGYYKNPQSIAHKVLADRISERDPGNKPKANDRIPYAYIELDKDDIFDFENPYKSGKKKGKPRLKNILQGNRIETPEYIKNNKLNIDYLFYIEKQIMNPVKQVMDLNKEYLDNNNELFDNFIMTYEILCKKYNIT